MLRDTFERDDCGAFVYPNGFRMPLEETGAIWQACELWHGGQRSSLYALMSSGHATPSVVWGASCELNRAIELSSDVDCDTLQAQEDLSRWADGIEGLLGGESC